MAVDGNAYVDTIEHVDDLSLVEDGNPLSWFQERMWVHYQRDPRNTNYNLPLLLSVRGNVDVTALERSLSLIVERHESLRTAYAQADDGRSVQVVRPARPVRLPVLDVDREGLLAELERVLEHRFDLGGGEVFVASLVRLAPDRHLLLLNVHHIAADAWSLQSVFFSELQRAYAAYCLGREPELPPLPVQYSSWAQAQRTADASADLDHWREVLAGYEDTLELPSVHPRRHRSGTTSATLTHEYPAEFALRLERFARDHDCTIFMCLLAGLAVAVGRYTDRDDLCLGTTMSTRTDVDLEPLIGFFVNILPLRLRVDEQATVAQLLDAVRSLVLDAFEHPAPFEQILRATDVARRDSRNPLVPIVMRHQNFPQTPLGTPLPDGVTINGYPEPDDTDPDVERLLAREHVPARAELELSYVGTGDELTVEVSYASDLHDAAAVARLLAHQQQVLEGMIADPGRRLLDVEMLREDDVRELLAREARTPVTPAPSWTFVERFAEQAAATPDALACRDEHRQWTYADLAARAATVAGALAARGAGAGDLVGVCLPRGGELLATLLGVWTAGAAYVPLDPNYPTAYSLQILDDAAPVVVACSTQQQAALGLDDARVLAVDALATPERGAVSQLSAPTDPDALAYVMYTSGSTGRPKGVRVPHRQLVNWLAALEVRLPFADGEVVGQKTTSVFAVGVKELFAGLLNGCPQVTIPDATVRDTAAFAAALAEHRVSRLNIVPSHLAALLEHLRETGTRLPALRVCVAAGEALPSGLVATFRELLPGARLLNNYGCTELNDVCYYDTAGFDPDTAAGRFVPIGTPIANTTVFVLDRCGRLVPDGVPGELHVASVGMPEGYHGRDDLTAERFVAHPVAPGARLYNTGDVVRRLPDGTLDFIGRWDFQVKVRGFRVEVRQVEQVMGEVDGVLARAVVGDGDRLVGYYTCRTGAAVDAGDLRAHLRERLPSYLVPDLLVPLEAMPSLPNGKLDRRALMGRAGGLGADEHEPPATETERTLAAIWGVIVNVSVTRIGRRTNFFEIGGHSLSAMRVLARIRDSFGVDVALSELFDAPRLDAVAAVIDGRLERREGGSATRSPGHARRPAKGTGLLHDKVVLVTGGSRGIGMATSLLLAEQGATVAVNYRDSEAQARHVKDLITADGGTADVFGADVTDEDQVQAMIDAVHERFGRVDVLVANAHMHFRHRPFLDYEWDDLERKLGNELKAVFHPCRAVAKEMVARRDGSIILVSSTLSKRSSPGFLAQSTAKGAVDAFVRSMATELGQYGVRVNTLAPGLTLTDAAMPMAPHVKEAIAAASPMRRNGLPDDIAGAVVFLASDLARFVTGTYLPVDGGFTML